ncbi:hypothetical protein GUJ93_ZPchr0010g8273 [Zizania palustris]|uniref:Uncharacterized protein n=1 Tax=Zizania palustris TaxID=103762 RepID=A0A8J5W6A9_ZIZPA|nr:hypothetical protein GUJ93_ZPchr0010g8273 [Zizania palustris]
MESEALSQEDAEEARATESVASAPAWTEVVAVEEMGPQVAGSLLGTSKDSCADFLRMFEHTNSLDQSPISDGRDISAGGPSTVPLPVMKRVSRIVKTLLWW